MRVTSALVSRTMALGDVICAEPVVRALKNKGYKHISFLSENYQEVFHNHPFLIPAYDLPQPCCHFDLDGKYERKLELYIVDAYLDAFGLTLPSAEKKPRIYLSDKEINWGRNALGTGRCALLDIGRPSGALGRGFWEFRDWLPVCKSLKQRGFRIVVVGNYLSMGVVVDRSYVDYDLRGKTNLRELFAVINAADLFVGVDSGPMHAAQALGVKGVAIFNPSHPAPSLLHPDTTIIPIHVARTEPLDIDRILAVIGWMEDGYD